MKKKYLIYIRILFLLLFFLYIFKLNFNLKNNFSAFDTSIFYSITSGQYYKENFKLLDKKIFYHPSEQTGIYHYNVIYDLLNYIIYKKFNIEGIFYLHTILLILLFILIILYLKNIFLKDIFLFFLSLPIFLLFFKLNFFYSERIIFCIYLLISLILFDKNLYSGLFSFVCILVLLNFTGINFNIINKYYFFIYLFLLLFSTIFNFYFFEKKYLFFFLLLGFILIFFNESFYFFFILVLFFIKGIFVLNKKSVFFDKFIKKYLYILILIFIIIIFFKPSPYQKSPQLERMLNFLHMRIKKANMFTIKEYSSYIIFRSFPVFDYKIYIDNFLKNKEKEKDYNKILEASSESINLIKKYNFDLIILPYTNNYMQLIKSIIKTDEFLVLYHDGENVIFSKKGFYKEKKYPAQAYIHLGYAFLIKGNDRKAEELFRKALSIDKDNKHALRFLKEIYKKREEKILKNFR